MDEKEKASLWSILMGKGDGSGLNNMMSNPMLNIGMGLLSASRDDTVDPYANIMAALMGAQKQKQQHEYEKSLDALSGQIATAPQQMPQAQTPSQMQMPQAPQAQTPPQMSPAPSAQTPPQMSPATQMPPDAMAALLGQQAPAGGGEQPNPFSQPSPGSSQPGEGVNDPQAGFETLIHKMLRSGNPKIQEQALKALQEQRAKKDQLLHQVSINPSAYDTRPAAVRETEWYMSQPDEVKDAHMGLKRTQQIVDLGGGESGVVRGNTVEQLTDGTVAERDAYAQRIKRIETALGDAQGAAQAGQYGDYLVAKRGVDTVDALRNHPGLKKTTGILSLNPAAHTPGTDAYNFAILNKQAQGQVFMAAYQGLKGGGQITEIEGLKAEQAIARLDNAQSREEYNAALNDLEQAMLDGYEKIRRQAAGDFESPDEVEAGGPNSKNTAGRGAATKRFNPETGKIEVIQQ